MAIDHPRGAGGFQPGKKGSRSAGMGLATGKTLTEQNQLTLLASRPKGAGTLPAYGKADWAYGPVRMAETLIGISGAFPAAGLASAALTEAGVLPSVTEQLGLKRGIQTGWAKAPEAKDKVKETLIPRKSKQKPIPTLLGTTPMAIGPFGLDKFGKPVQSI